MPMIKTVTLPSQMVLQYHVIQQIDLPIYQEGKGWLPGVFSVARYATKAAFLSGSSPYDTALITLPGLDFLALDFSSDSAMLASSYGLIVDKSVAYGDAEID